MSIPKHILHADDDPLITAVLAATLREEGGYEVTSINDPTEVLPALVRQQHRVVVLDIDMPKIDGIQLLRQIKAFDGGIQVVMLTGMVTMSTVLQTLQTGAEACFFKPIENFAPLLAALDDCFRKSERWWATLDELSRRRRAEAALR
jgi:CheY-like chemotaxis protein